MKYIYILLFVFNFSAVLFAAEPEVKTEYLAVILDGKKIGRVIHSRSEKDGIVTTKDDTKMTIMRGGISISVGIIEQCVETIKGQPISFEVVQNISNMNNVTRGKVTDGKIEIEMEAFGTTQKKTMDWPQGAMMVEGIRLLELEKPKTRGTTYTATMFVPSMMTAIEADVTVGGQSEVDLFGRVVTATEVITVMTTPAGDMKSTTYVDKDFNALKTLMPMMGMNMEIIACTKEFALSDNDIIDFLDRMLIQSPQPLVDLKPGQSAVYTLSPKPAAQLKIPATDNQEIHSLPGGKIQVIVKPVEIAKEVKFPYSGSDPAVLDALKPTQYLQCDKKEIMDLAHNAVGGATDAAMAAKKIESFVNGYIRTKDLSIGYASASEVAKSRQGDCTEHAVLTAAMCRAVGIPARVVFGLVFVDEFAGRKNVFGGHAWTEVFLDGKWAGLDATRAPVGFGAGHITLATGNGDPKDFFGMVTTLGYFKIDSIVLK